MTSTTFVELSLSRFLSEVIHQKFLSLEFSIGFWNCFDSGRKLSLFQAGGCFGLWLGLGVVQAMDFFFRVVPLAFHKLVENTWKVSQKYLR